MSTALIDFLNHGLLPFVGREGTIGKITSFWQGSSDSSELRSALLVGEAGIGKSRLMEEAVPLLVRQGAVVVAIRLYPEAIASVTTMIARAIRLLNSGRHLPIPDPEESLSSVVSTLRRLARLRPILLVIEDIHLLQGGTPAEELLRLLGALSNEPIPLLVVSRPMETGVWGLLEPSLVEEIEIPPLKTPEIRELWKTIFNHSPNTGIIEALYESTLGNPLALRSALRGAVTSGAIAHDPVDDRWKVTIPHAELAHRLQHNVRLLSEGMVAHLSTTDRTAAARLAWLGEVFSREAAHGMIPRADEVLERLSFKGIIAQTTSAAPLPGGSSDSPPLGFSQSVLHRYLVDSEKIDTDALVGVISAELPLYSALPFRLLQAHPRTDGVNRETLRRTVLRLLEIGRLLDARSDWHLGIDALGAAESLAAFDQIDRSVSDDPESEEIVRAQLLISRFMLRRRSNTPDESKGLANELMALTATPTPKHLLDHRLLAFTFMIDQETPDQGTFDAVWSEAQELVRVHPDLRFSIRYMSFLEAVSGCVGYLSGNEELAPIEEEVRTLMESSEASADYRRLARHILVLHFVDMFTDHPGLEARRRDLRELELVVDPKRRMSFLFHKLMFYRAIGELEEVLNITETALPLFRTQGLLRNHTWSLLAAFISRLSLGNDVDDIPGEIARIIEPVPQEIRPRFLLFIEMALLEVEILRGDGSWRVNVPSLVDDAYFHLRPEAQLVLWLEQEYPMPPLAETARVATPGFRPVVDLLLEGTICGVPSMYEAIRSAISQPLLRINHAIERIALLLLIGKFQTQTPNAPAVIELCNRASATVSETLEWMAERNLLPFLQAMVKRFGDFLPESEQAAWSERIQTMTDEIERRQIAKGGMSQRAHLSMLGSIEFTDTDGKTTSVRGSKARRLLGLMVADQMIDQPLSMNEFAAIITGVDDDLDRARRLLNGLVHRLREMIGHDMIVTDAGVPRLNTRLVEVDILQAMRLIAQGEASLRQGRLQHALAALRSSIEILGGEVSFPTLYERFFEAARDDIEYKLRWLIIATARGLLDEGDPAAAEELLRRGLEAIPDDAELIDLLAQSLSRVGRRIEAERLRIFRATPERN
jgi:tetratricopeptide (TPR) repeat protein